MFKKIIQAAKTGRQFSYINWILIGAGVYTIAPFLFLAQYDQPSADDYTLAVRDSRNALSVVLKDVYANWSGRYLAPVFSRLNPLLYNPSWYKIYPIILIVSFVISIILVVRELLRTKCSFIEVAAISSIFIHLIFSQTPSSSEAFYWFSGSCIYQTSSIFTLLLITVLSKLKRSVTSISKASYTLLAAILCILIIGCNEVSMVIVFFIVFGISIKNYAIYKKIRLSDLILLIVCILCSAAVFFAPGNLSRIDDPVYYNRSPIWTVFGAVSVTILYILKWGISVLAATLVYLLFYSEKIGDEPKLNQESFHIKGSIFYFVAVFISLQVIIIYIAGGGNLGPHRE